MLGAVIGDIIGSVYEFKNHRSKYFEPLFHPQARFTDDTLCTVAIADALVRGTAPHQATLNEWCHRYAENGGWGKSFAEWFMDDNPQPYGSWGNGTAMRISPVGFLATSEDEAICWADAATAITHNHPEGIASVRAVALAIFWARNKAPALKTPFVMRCLSGVTATPLRPLRAVWRKPCTAYQMTSPLKPGPTCQKKCRRFSLGCMRKCRTRRVLAADVFGRLLTARQIENPDAITAGSVASDAISSKPTTAQLGEGAGFLGIVQLNCHH